LSGYNKKSFCKIVIKSFNQSIALFMS